MGGRNKREFALLVGGPFDSDTELLPLSVSPSVAQGHVIVRWKPSDTPGMRVSHRYILSTKRRKLPQHPGGSYWIANFVGADAEEPISARRAATMHDLLPGLNLGSMSSYPGYKPPRPPDSVGLPISGDAQIQ